VIQVRQQSGAWQQKIQEPSECGAEHNPFQNEFPSSHSRWTRQFVETSYADGSIGPLK
jgi:hypothetical protein